MSRMPSLRFPPPVLPSSASSRSASPPDPVLYDSDSLEDDAAPFQLIPSPEHQLPPRLSHLINPSSSSPPASSSRASAPFRPVRHLYEEDEELVSPSSSFTMSPSASMDPLPRVSDRERKTGAQSVRGGGGRGGGGSSSSSRAAAGGRRDRNALRLDLLDADEEESLDEYTNDDDDGDERRSQPLPPAAAVPSSSSSSLIARRAINTQQSTASHTGSAAAKQQKQQTSAASQPSAPSHHQPSAPVPIRPSIPVSSSSFPSAASGSGSSSPQASLPSPSLDDFGHVLSVADGAMRDTAASQRRKRGEGSGRYAGDEEDESEGDVIELEDDERDTESSGSAGRRFRQDRAASATQAVLSTPVKSAQPHQPAPLLASPGLRSPPPTNQATLFSSPSAASALQLQPAAALPGSSYSPFSSSPLPSRRGSGRASDASLLSAESDADELDDEHNDQQGEERDELTSGVISLPSTASAQPDSIGSFAALSLHHSPLKPKHDSSTGTLTAYAAPLAAASAAATPSSSSSSSSPAVSYPARAAGQSSAVQYLSPPTSGAEDDYNDGNVMVVSTAHRNNHAHPSSASQPAALATDEEEEAEPAFTVQEEEDSAPPPQPQQPPASSLPSVSSSRAAGGGGVREEDGIAEAKKRREKLKAKKAKAMAKKTQQQQLDSLRRNRNADEEVEDEHAAAAAAAAAKYRPRRGRPQREEDKDEQALDARAEGEGEEPSELETDDESTDEDEDDAEEEEDEDEEEGEQEQEQEQGGQRSARTQHSRDASGSSPPFRATAGSDAQTRNAGPPAVFQLGGRQALPAQFSATSSSTGSSSSVPPSPLRVGQLSGNGGSTSSTSRRTGNASRFSSNQSSSRSPSPTVVRREERMERRASRQLTADRALPADAVYNNDEEEQEAADSQVGSRRRASKERRVSTASETATALALPLSLTRTGSRGGRKKRRGGEEDFQCSDLVFQEKIGEGAYGSVHRAFLWGSEVAAKLIRIDSREEAQQARREMRIMRQLRHPNVVEYLGSCVTDRQLVLLTEYLSCGSLEDELLRLRRAGKRMREPRCVSLALDVVRGLNWLHHKGIIHRDLKSANILIDSAGRGKLADFGLSHVRRRKEESLQGYHGVAGSPSYIAPEVLQQREYGAAADVYSFAVLLNEMCSGQTPYDDTQLASMELDAFEKAVIAGGRPQLAACDSAQLQQLIVDCWQGDPQLRPTVELIMKRLERLDKGAAAAAATGAAGGAAGGAAAAALSSLDDVPQSLRSLLANDYARLYSLQAALAEQERQLREATAAMATEKEARKREHEQWERQKTRLKGEGDGPSQAAPAAAAVLTEEGKAAG